MAINHFLPFRQFNRYVPGKNSNRVLSLRRRVVMVTSCAELCWSNSFLLMDIFFESVKKPRPLIIIIFFFVEKKEGQAIVAYNNPRCGQLGAAVLLLINTCTSTVDSQSRPKKKKIHVYAPYVCVFEAKKLYNCHCPCIRRLRKRVRKREFGVPGKCSIWLIWYSRLL